MINISVSDSLKSTHNDLSSWDVENVEQVLRKLLQDETVEVSERSRGNYVLKDQEV